MKTRKFTLPTPLLKLTDDQLAELHSWFKRSTYPEILARLRDRFGVHMSKTQLCRYYQRFAEANLFNAVLHTPLTPADMLAIQKADPLRDAISDAVHAGVLKKHCIRLARSPDITVTTLKHLHDVATYNQRRELKQRDQKLAAMQLTARKTLQRHRDFLRELKIAKLAAAHENR